MLRADTVVEPDHGHVRYSGRRQTTEEGGVRFAYSGARVRLAFKGSRVALRMDDLHKGNWVNVFLDGERTDKILIKGKGGSYTLAAGLDPDRLHTVEVVKATEGFLGSLVFHGFGLNEGAETRPWPDPETRRIEFIGDSITCGYGIEADTPDTPFVPEEENFCDTFAWRAARALDADYQVVARSGIGIYRNYDGPREGNAKNMRTVYDQTFFNHEDPEWDHARFVPEVICINLGTNDFSTDGPDVETFVEAYVSFVKRLGALRPEAKIVVLAGPLNDKPAYVGSLERVVERTRETLGERVSLFRMTPQGNHGFGAHWHPSRAQAKVNGRELAVYLSDLMDWELEGAGRASE